MAQDAGSLERSRHMALPHQRSHLLRQQLVCVGGVLNNTVPARGFWGPKERGCHITELELEAEIRTVRTFLSHLRGKHVLLREDNMGVVGMLAHYSTRSPQIMRRLRQL